MLKFVPIIVHSWTPLTAESSFSYYTVLYIAGSVVGFVGLVYIGLHFMPMIEPPSSVDSLCPLRETDADLRDRTMQAPPIEADAESQRLSGA
jgi:hypothetical protein